ncbi:MAG: hypothetical protein RMM53_01245 [Bacteroidia bacterium]|nr:hypothetical protein [Bacteroidia bacterium]MDW8332819.1 hypothetical protein [Bacteroidia bacterium]
MQFFVDFGDVGALTEAGSALSDAADLKTWDGAALDAPFATKEFAKITKYYLDALQNTLSDKKR